MPGKLLTSITRYQAKGYRPGDLFFFDTETTGLGGGTGNTIFLLGYAYIDGDGDRSQTAFLAGTRV